MSRMDEVATLLAHSDDLLWGADLEQIEADVARGGPVISDDEYRSANTCAWCEHAWHGMACANTVLEMDPQVYWRDADAAQHVPLGAYCHCTSSMERLDDTWRPLPGAMLEWRAARVLRRMHEEGLDGWAARAVCERSRLGGTVRLAQSGAEIVGRVDDAIRVFSASYSIEFRDPDPELVRILSGYSVDSVDSVDPVARARARRGSGPPAAGPERSRRPRRI